MKLTRGGPITMQTHRDSDISSLVSRPHDTDLNVVENLLHGENGIPLFYPS